MIRTTVLTVLLLIGFDATAATSLWRVSGGQHTLLLGGTVHVLSEVDYPLPTEFERAFGEAAELMFETDLQALETPVFSQELMQRLSYPRNRSLRDDLSRSTLRALERYCRDNDIFLPALERFRAPLVVLTLLNKAFEEVGLVAVGVDAHFYQRAKTRGKPTLQLEAASQQLEFIVNMGRGQEDELVMGTLRDVAEIDVMIRQILTAWRAGDSSGLAALLLEPMQQDSPQLYQTLVVDRNRAWMPKIEAELLDPGTELVLVGALHLIGSDGLLQRLRSAGYRVERY